MGYAETSRMRARKRAARRCAPQSAPARDEVLDLLQSVEVEEDAPESEPLLETPDIFEPEPELEVEFEFAANDPLPAPAVLNHALGIAVDAAATGEANDNIKSAAPVVSVRAPAPEREAPAPIDIAALSSVDEEDAPFDAPDVDDEIFQAPKPHARRWSDPADVLELHTPAPPSFPHEPTATRPPARPAPAISIHVNWDRTAGSQLAERLAAEPLLARADISDARGGVGGAAPFLARANAPDVLILETTLHAEPLLAAIDALQPSLSGGVKLFIVGDVNDVTLLRALARRGIVHYFLAPADAHEIALAICDLHAEADKSRVVAVVGSRGGVGTSCIAHNLAWSFSERFDASTTLIELDLAFGATAFSFDQRPSHAVIDGVQDPQSINEDFLDRVGTMQTERLRIVSGPGLQAGVEMLERPAVGALIRNARRMSKVVVLDVPHHWDACIKDVLERANDVLIVATPDLASLRNTKNLLEALKHLRPAGHEPMVLLSMVGAAKESEISDKDFGGAIDVKPLLSFEFDPALFAGSVMRRQMLGEAAPQSLAARRIDELAALITGRKPVKRSSTRKRSPLRESVNDAAPAQAPMAPEPQTTIVPAEPRSDAATVLELTDLLVAEAPAAPPPQPKRRKRPRALSRHQCALRPAPRRAPAQPGTLRLAAALMALLAASMWYVEKRTDIDFISYAIASGR